VQYWKPGLFVSSMGAIGLAIQPLVRVRVAVHGAQMPFLRKVVRV